jgi:hypothetical protein
MSRLVPVEHAHFADSRYELSELADKRGRLTLQLEGEGGQQVEIFFDDYIFYSKIDEGDALRTLELVKAQSFIGQTLVMAQDSELAAWVADESFGIRSVDQLQHYVILALNDIVNVISLSAPKIIGQKN